MALFQTRMNRSHSFNILPHPFPEREDDRPFSGPEDMRTPCSILRGPASLPQGHESTALWSCQTLSYRTPSFPGGRVLKNTPVNAGDIRDLGSMPGSGRSPGEGNGNPLWYSCLENSKDRGAGWATVHGISKSGTQMSTHACTAYKE